MSPRAHVCDVCGYALGVVPVAVLVDGRLSVELHLCGHCKTRTLDAIERAVDYVKEGVPRASVRTVLYEQATKPTSSGNRGCRARRIRRTLVDDAGMVDELDVEAIGRSPACSPCCKSRASSDARGSQSSSSRA